MSDSIKSKNLAASVSRAPVMQLLSPRDLINIVRQRWMLAATTGFVLAALFVFILLKQTPQYEAEATIVFELNAENIVNVQEVVESGVQNTSLLAAAMNTHIQRIKSRTMAKTIADTLTEEEKKSLIIGFIGPLEERDTEETLPDPAGLLSGNMVSVTWDSNSQVMRVAVTHQDRHLAKTIADRYATRYIESQSELRGQSTDQAVLFLDEQTDALRQRLELEEKALQEYRNQNDLVTVEQNQLIVTERLKDLNAEITSARVRLLGAESRIKQINSAGDDLDLLMNIPFIGGRANIEKIYNELQTLKTQERVLAETYLERHPKVIENATEQNAVEASLWISIRQAGNEVEIERQIIADELESLNQKLKEAEQEARRLESLSIQYRVLARRVDAQREIFDRVTERFNETSIAQQMDLTTMRILDLSQLPKSPVWPDKKVVGLAAVLIFCFCFVGMPFACEFFDNRLRTFADIERFVGKLILGDLPEISDESEMEIAQEAINFDKGVAENFRSILGYLRLQLGDTPPPHVFLFTSSVPAEGKSVVASNLGYVFAAHQYKTILIDFDLRRPSVHRYKGMNNSKGLIEWVRSSQPIAEDILKDENLGIRKVPETDSFYVLTSGGSTRQASETLGHERVDILLSRLRQEFDVILIDTPPVGVFQDATIAAAYADHTIFVARQNSTTRQKTRYSVGLMDRTDAPVLGVVFNGVKELDVASAYGSSDGYAESYAAKYQYGYGKSGDKYKKYYADKG